VIEKGGPVATLRAAQSVVAGVCLQAEAWGRPIEQALKQVMQGAQMPVWLEEMTSVGPSNETAASSSVGAGSAQDSHACTAASHGTVAGVALRDGVCMPTASDACTTHCDSQLTGETGATQAASMPFGPVSSPPFPMHPATPAPHLHSIGSLSTPPERITCLPNRNTPDKAESGVGASEAATVTDGPSLAPEAAAGTDGPRSAAEPDEPATKKQRWRM